MALNPWPSTLPNTFNANSYQEQLGDLEIHSEPSQGPYLTRKRYTAMPDRIRGEMTLTAAQAATLKAFYKSQAGIRFEWDNDIVTGLHYYLFVGPPVFTMITGELYRVSMEFLQFTTETGNV